MTKTELVIVDGYSRIASDPNRRVTRDHVVPEHRGTTTAIDGRAYGTTEQTEQTESFDSHRFGCYHKYTRVRVFTMHLGRIGPGTKESQRFINTKTCLLYTSDAADE